MITQEVVTDKITVRAISFGSLSRGGYFQMYESTSHPGIMVTVKKQTKRDPLVRIFTFRGVEYTDPAAVIKAYQAKVKL